MILCKHRKQTTPRCDEEGEYRRCLDWGGRLPWSWPENLLTVAPTLNQPSWPADLDHSVSVMQPRRQSA